jgi:hypothetical protein
MIDEEQQTPGSGDRGESKPQPAEGGDATLAAGTRTRLVVSIAGEEPQARSAGEGAPDRVKGTGRRRDRQMAKAS